VRQRLQCDSTLGAEIAESDGMTVVLLPSMPGQAGAAASDDLAAAPGGFVTAAHGRVTDAGYTNLVTH
jgi:hypothetical protein